MSAPIRYTVAVEYDGETHTPERLYGMSKAAATWAGLLVADFVVANPDFFTPAERDDVTTLIGQLESVTDEDFTTGRVLTAQVADIVVRLLWVKSE